jgi:ABC-type transport system involved in Fe-S cluster assembly fused permease/ATPase subunit
MFTILERNELFLAAVPDNVISVCPGAACALNLVLVKKLVFIVWVYQVFTFIASAFAAKDRRTVKRFGPFVTKAFL